jgi:hypothetical protein
MAAIMKFIVSLDGTHFHVTSAGKVSLGAYLSEIASGSRWAHDANDQFPSGSEMVGPLSNKCSAGSATGFQCIITGLCSVDCATTGRSRDERSAEIIAAYYIETACRYPLTEWEPDFAGKTADFSILVSDSTLSTEILVGG